MDKLDALENQIQQLSSAELVEFRRWFAEFDGDLWDQQIKADIKAGKFDEMARRALDEHSAGRTTEL